ncbi:MAG: molecular chaperone HtpG [Candidatus Fimenecus sp.]
MYTMKQFKAESKKLLDMMINSIYTHKEIFLRELISNASDAIDKLYFKSLTDENVKLKKSDFEIRISNNEKERTLTITDNGIGMTKDELEKNLGTIAKSGSFDFKNETNGEKAAKKVDVIGQFGVGFYSAFMVADKLTVESLAFGEKEAFRWESSGADGYEINPCNKESVGTTVILHLKSDNENENYSEFLEQYKISNLVKKYSDYVRYPIKMNFTITKPKPHTHKDGEECNCDEKTEYETVIEDRTLNSMVPLWKKQKSKIKEDEYADFYKSSFMDWNNPLKVIHYSTEGSATFTALLFIPEKAPFDFYSKEFEKGLKLYSRGVLITEKCKELLPDHFSFVRGLIDSEDVSLNISREILQSDYQLKLIAKALERKIKNELVSFLEKDREGYEKFFREFGTQLTYGVYSEYGAKKDDLKDLLLFHSSKENKLISLKEYREKMDAEQKSIYYACGESIEKINLLPKVQAVKNKGFDILYLTQYVDEFAIKTLNEYDEKSFMNVCTESEELLNEDEKKNLESKNTEAAELFEFMKNCLGEKVVKVQYAENLGENPVCITTEGEISLEMQKILNAMPGAVQQVQSKMVLEINSRHKIAEKLSELFKNDKDVLKNYTEILFDEALLIGGITPDDPVRLSRLTAELLTK